MDFSDKTLVIKEGVRVGIQSPVNRVEEKQDVEK